MINETMRAVFVAETATLERVIEEPVGPFGYGVELSCSRDLTPDMLEVDPFSYEGIAEAVLRRWDTPRGSNLDDLDYGENISSMLNAPHTRQSVLAKAGSLRAEAEKDDRVDDCVVTLTPNSNGSVIRISAAITPADPDLTEFTLVAALDSAGLLLEEIRTL